MNQRPPYDGTLYVVMSDCGKPLLSTVPEPWCKGYDIVHDDPTPQQVEWARAGLLNTFRDDPFSPETRREVPR